MKNNKGMSMIEIILVLAILALLSTGMLTGINYIQYGNTKKCSNLIDSALDKVRIDAMSKAEKPYLYLYEFEGSYYMLESAETTPTLDSSGTKLGNRQVRLYYSTDPGGVAEITSSIPLHYMKIGFVKSTGGIAQNADNSYYDEILIKNGAGTETRYTITLIKATGKHYIEK